MAGAQVRSDALAALRRSGDIGDRHLAAAERWCVDWTMGVEGARRPLRPTSGQAGDRDIGMLSRIKASARCEKVRLALGASAELRLRMTIIDELSFCEIGRRLMPGDINGRKKIAAQLRCCLKGSLSTINRATGTRPSNRDPFDTAKSRFVDIERSQRHYQNTLTERVQAEPSLRSGGRSMD